MTEFAILPESPEEKYPDPERGPSTIIFKKTKYDGLQSISYDQGDAFWEQEGGILEDQIDGMLDDDLAPGWYVMEGFEVDYSRDYYGEVSGYADCKVPSRPATFRDFEKLAWVEGPWFVRLMAILRMPMPSWWPEP